MKRMLSFCLAVLLLLTLPGCRKTQEMETPVDFYYVRREPKIGSEDSVVTSELRESAGLTAMELMNIYLQGPKSAELANVFPTGTKVLELAVEENTLFITLSAPAAELSGIELTLATACLGKTCMAYFQISSLEICVEDGLLGGSEVIAWNADSMVYYDAQQEITDQKD